MGTGTSRQISAFFYQFNTQNVDIFIAAVRVLSFARALTKSGGIKHNKVIFFPVGAFLTQEFKYVGALSFYVSKTVQSRIFHHVIECQLRHVHRRHFFCGHCGIHRKTAAITETIQNASVYCVAAERVAIFLLIEKILKQITAKIILVELHAEATSEKLAMGYMLDGRVSAVWGTHTHVPTADVQVLPKGTGYVTDLGMTGPKHSVLGIRPELSIAKFRGDLTERYRWADGPTKLEAVLFTIDSATGKCLKAERVDEWD